MERKVIVWNGVPAIVLLGRNMTQIMKLEKESSENQYKSALYLLEKNLLELKPMEEYLEFLDPRIKDELMIEERRSGMKIFNLPLFYQTLVDRVNPKDIPLFLFTKIQSIGIYYIKELDLDKKIPDPNESWGSFMKRILNFEIYQPPLV